MSMQNNSNANVGNTTTHLLQEGFFLTVALFVVRLIGVFYRIPLTNIWGDAALGTYSDAYTIYSLFLLFSSVSVPTMMSKLISEKAAVGKIHDIQKIKKCSLILFSLLGLIGCLIMFFGAEFFAEVIFNNPDLKLPIQGLAPTVLIVSVLSVYRGFFCGLNNLRPSGISQMIESLVHAVASIILALSLLKYGLQISLLGGIIATGIAALFSFFFLLWCYRYYCRRSEMKKAKASLSQESDIAVYKAILLMALPIVLSNVIYNLKTIIDSAVFGHLMEWKGFDLETIKAMKGLYSGKFSVFLAVPIAIGDSVSTAVVPSIAADYSVHDIKSVRKKASEVTKTVLLITLPASVGLLILGKPIVKMFFSSAPLGGELFWFGSLAAAFYSVSDISTGILQGAGHQNKPMWNSLWATLLTVVLNAVMIALNVGIYTLPISMLLFSIIRMILNVYDLKKYCKIRIRVLKMATKPFIGCFVMAVFTVLSYLLSFSIFGSNMLALVVAIIVSVFVYFFVLVNLDWLKEKDMELIPYCGKYLKYLKIRN